MVRVARFIGFLISAVGVQLASGIGLAALVAAVALGWFRCNVLWIVGPTIGGAVAAHILFEDVASAGKVVNAMSNLAFDFIVFFAICAVGYAIGAITRRWR